MALIKKRFWELEKKNVFQNPLYFEKSNLALVWPNLHSRTILQKQISFICMKAPRTERVARIFKKRPLLPNPNSSLHNDTFPYIHHHTSSSHHHLQWQHQHLHLRPGQKTHQDCRRAGDWSERVPLAGGTQLLTRLGPRSGGPSRFYRFRKIPRRKY